MLKGISFTLLELHINTLKHNNVLIISNLSRIISFLYQKLNRMHQQSTKDIACSLITNFQCKKLTKINFYLIIDKSTMKRKKRRSLLLERCNSQRPSGSLLLCRQAQGTITSLPRAPPLCESTSASASLPPPGPSVSVQRLYTTGRTCGGKSDRSTY